MEGLRFRTIQCARCGEKTVAKGPSQKYCPTCAYQERLERQAAKREESKRELMEARAALFHDALEAARASGKEPPKKKTKRIRCERCGAEVEVPVMAARAKFCPACATASVREKNRQYRERAASLGEGELTTGKCSCCGKNFSYIYEGKRRTKCDACRKYDEAGRMRRKKEREQCLEEGGKFSVLFRSPTKAEIERELRQRRIDEIQRAAQAAGMSYGKYKAMLEMQKAKKGA